MTATLVVAVLRADNENLEKGPGMTPLTNPVIGTRCANRATTGVAPAALNLGGRRFRGGARTADSVKATTRGFL